MFESGGDDYLDAGDGDGYLNGNPGNNQMFGREGNDQIIGSLGNDLLDGGFGNDTSSDFGGTNTLLGRSGNDEIAFRGHDTVSAGDGADRATWYGSATLDADLSTSAVVPTRSRWSMTGSTANPATTRAVAR